VSLPTDKLSEPLADLPNPELNPLLNPVLSRHLGQWAHVYFTTAPEKREEALYELLDELKEEEARNGVPSASEGETEPSAGIYAIVCPKCERSNVRSQKYCGMCGSPMPVRAHAAAAANSGAFGDAMFAPIPEHIADAGYSQLEPSPVPDVLGRAEATEQRGAFAATSLLFQPETLAAAEANDFPEPKPVDIDWLRQRNTPAPAKSGNLRIATYGLATAVLVCGAILFYLYLRRTEARGNAPLIQGPVASQPQPATSPTRGSSPATYDAQTRTQTTEGQLRSQREEAHPGARESTFPAQPDAQPPKSVPDATAPAASDTSQNGAIEVAAAKDYLSGRKGAPDGATAAKLLWRAVSKQNGEALLMLSDLYATGDGVPKSCDQARLLVDAALHRNVATADVKLRNLQQSCP
jgi:hypothetical protein